MNRQWLSRALALLLAALVISRAYAQPPPNFRLHPTTLTHQTDVRVARHPGNPNIILAFANTIRVSPFFISQGVYVTTNGGITWSGSDTITFPLGGPSSPVYAIDKDGHLLACGYGGSGLVVSFSTDYGRTWSAPFSIPGSSGADVPRIGTDDAPSSPYYGRSYIAWTNFGGTFTNRIAISRTTDGGATWTLASPVSPPPSSGHHHQGSGIRVGPNGEVYVVWANCTTNGQNSTEDSLGFAVSTDGGVTWARSTNSADDMNGVRAASFFNGIRSDGFPHIDVDKSGGARNGWIYVVAAEKNLPPYATDVSDIVLHRSTDGGLTWTRTRVNQDAVGNGKYQFMPSIRVDEAGGVNVAYYDSRNVPTNDSTEIYLSRSLDGGTTWSDMVVSDHRFKPESIPGLPAGYSGCRTSITSTDDHLLPCWSDNSTGITSTDDHLLPCWSDNSTGLNQVWAARVPLPSVSIISPNGGEVWVIGNVYPIMWAQSGVDTVRIEFSTNGPGGPWNLITPGVPASSITSLHPKMRVREMRKDEVNNNPSGVFNWLIPSNTTPSNNCYVRISQKSNPTINDFSNYAFVIIRSLPPDSLWVVQAS
ncbi:MAG: Sialidase protein, partial [Bacteroidetes bacterium]|nr:Sialidase protein [Bacteroidota bacterium]